MTLWEVHCTVTTRFTCIYIQVNSLKRVLIPFAVQVFEYDMMHVKLHVEVSTSLVVNFFRTKSENHRAMFSGESRISVVHAKVIFISLKQNLFSRIVCNIFSKTTAPQQVMF